MSSVRVRIFLPYSLGLFLLSAGGIFNQCANATTPVDAIAISRDGPKVSISFNGTLQWTDAVTGPWKDAVNKTSPFTEDSTDSKRFYRSVDTGSIFSSASVVELTLTAPFQRNFNLAFAGSPDGIFPPVRVKPYFDGMLSQGTNELPVSLRVRGNSSLQECPFPKLKFKVSKERRVGTPFFDAREIKIGTHCAEGGRGNIGRLREEAATYREALAYEVMELLGFVGPRVRRARIEYNDTTPIDFTSEVGWRLTRSAMLIDDVDVLAERLGGHALTDAELAALTDPKFDPQLVSDLQFLHALLGNWDYGINVENRGLWNTDVVSFQDGVLLPVAGDFDLSSWVTAVVRISAPRDYLPELPEVDRQVRYELELIQKRVSDIQFAASRTRFISKQAALQSQINTSLVDTDGRTNALRHTAAFFEALALIGR